MTLFPKLHVYLSLIIVFTVSALYPDFTQHKKVISEILEMLNVRKNAGYSCNMFQTVSDSVHFTNFRIFVLSKVWV